MEGNSYNVEFVGWVHHQCNSFQNGSLLRSSHDPKVCSFNVICTPLCGVFGGACEKYIILSVTEGLEILASTGQCSKHVEISVCTFSMCGRLL